MDGLTVIPKENIKNGEKQSICRIFLLLLLAGCNSPNNITAKVVYDRTFVSLAEGVNKSNLPIFNPDIVNNAENVQRVIESVNKLSELINIKTDYSIKLIDITEDKTDDILEKGDFLLRFAPIIQPYNEVINNAKPVDENNPYSIHQFSLSVGLFVFDIAVLNAKFIAKSVVYTGGYTLDYAKLIGISPKNYKAFFKYLGEEADLLFKERIIPAMNNILKE